MSGRLSKLKEFGYRYLAINPFWKDTFPVKTQIPTYRWPSPAAQPGPTPPVAPGDKVAAAPYFARESKSKVPTPKAVLGKPDAPKDLPPTPNACLYNDVRNGSTKDYTH